METTRIALFEDNPYLREGIASTLSVEGGCDVVAAGADTVRSWNGEASPDVVLFDLSGDTTACMSDFGLLSGAFPDAHIIGTNVPPWRTDFLEFVEAGVAGFVLRSAARDEYLEAVRKILRGECVFPEPVAAALSSKRAGRRIATTPGLPYGLAALTKRDREIVALVGEEPGNREISARLCISLHTTKCHVRNIMRKLGYRKRMQIMYLAWELRFLRGTGPLPRTGE